MHQTVYNKPRLRLVAANSTEGRRIARDIDTMKRRANDAKLATRQIRRAITRQSDHPTMQVTR